MVVSCEMLASDGAVKKCHADQEQEGRSVWS